MNEYKLPDVGEGLTEAEIVSWKVKAGDVIKVNDIVCDIETAKSIVELPSPYAGTIEELLVPEGETVEVGTPIIRIGDGSSTGATTGGSAAEVGTPPSDAPVEPGVEGSPAPKEERQPTLVGYGPREASGKRRPRKGMATPPSDAGEAVQQQVQQTFSPGAVAEPAATAQEPAVPAETTTPAEPEAPAAGGASTRALAKPPVRKLAKDLGIDLATVTPTGPSGTVTRADVENHAGAETGTAPEAAAPAAAAEPVMAQPRPGERETRTPIKGVRRMTAQAMTESAFTAPHVTEWVTVDVTRTVELVERLRTHRDFRDVRVSPLLVVAKAVCLAIRRNPTLNATWDADAQEIVLKHYVNLGIAAATPRGLVVPNIKDADRMTLPELAAAFGELIRTAREGRTQPAEMSGGSFTITNVGVFGVDAGTPILNPGESGILAFGAIRKQPWVVTTAAADGSGDEDEIVPRHVTTLALSFDHRLVDGEQGSRFLADVAGILEDPATALLF